MKKTTILISAFAALALASCGGANNQNSGSSDGVDTVAIETTTDTKATSTLNPVFVIADKLGTKFLLETSNGERKTPSQTPDSLKNFKYIINDGKYYPVKFVGYQIGNENADNARETWMNFDNMKGWVYEMQSGKLLDNPKDEFDAVWAYPLLVDDNFKNSFKVYPATSTFKNDSRLALPNDLASKFEEKYGRKIKDGFLDYTFGDNNEYKLANIQFQNKDNQALAVVAVVKHDGSISALDLPAEWNEESVWRVDDGGEFYGYGLNFATEKDGQLTIYTIDGGAEGINIDSYDVTADGLRQGKINASFYTSPE